MATRDRLVAGGRASTALFSLVLRPWIRQAQATGISMPYLVPLALRGVPANAWTRRTAEAVLWGLGIVVKVAESTARRHDMARFRVWLRIDDPARIPARRILVVEEPDRRALRLEDDAADALWYPVDIFQEAPPVTPRLAPHGSPPPPSEDADSDDGLDRRGRRGRSRTRGRRRGGSRRGQGPGRASPPARSSAGSAPPARQQGIQTGQVDGTVDQADQVGPQSARGPAATAESVCGPFAL